MDYHKNIIRRKTIKKQGISKLDYIKRYPFNGRSKYLIDRFYIIGYRPNQLHKILFNNPQNKKALQNISKKINAEETQNIVNKNQNTQNAPKNKLKIFLEEPPILLNEISSDVKKEIPDIDLINSMLFPNKINVYIKSESLKNKYPIQRRTTINIIQRAKSLGDDSINQKEKNDNDELKDNSTLKIMNSKQYNTIFSYNPQTGTNSKKSINGFAHVFFKEFAEKEIIDDIQFTFYVPVTFCIISEFPYFNSYYKLCKQIIQLFQFNKNEIPLEILIYNIINFCLSPINGEVSLNIEPANFPSKKTIISSYNKIKKEKIKDKEIDKEIHIIKEEEEPDEDFNPFNLYQCEINDLDKYKDKDKQNNDNNYKIESPILKPKPKINVCGTPKNILRKSERLPKNKDIEDKINTSPDFPRKTSKKLESLQGVRNTIGIGQSMRSPKFISSEDDSDLNDDLLKNFINNGHEDIKFQSLSGYPLIQYNLAKVLLNKLSPQDVMIIFFYSFLEKDILFFSKSLEYLSFTINSYLNLNFPLNDEKYYFFNACVSYDNFINDNSPFVGATFTTILGINSEYNGDYLNKTKLKEHLAVDLDKGVIYMNEDPNDKEKNMKNKILFDYIKKICRKEIKDDKGVILVREVKILFDKLESYKNNLISNESQLSSSFMSVSSKNMIRINRNNNYNNFIDYDDRGQNSIKNKNRNIQEGFYRLINYICLYFYQNLSLKSDDDKEDLNKIIINRKNKGLNTDTDTMNIIFHKDYDTDDNNYTKEEIYLLDELMDTMKFESFVYGFIQSYNPIDLYKIPLTMTEEFISILSRKNFINHQNINFFSLIDNIYKKNGVEKTYVDFNPFSAEYCKDIKKYFDREIYDENYNINNINNNSNNINSNKKKVKEKFIDVQLMQSDEGKIINNIKYKEYILDNNLLLKYILFLKNTKKEEYYQMFHLAGTLEQNKIKSISITEIENEIEKYSTNLDILSKRDICCSNIILLFTLSLKTIKNYIDCQSFLSALFQNFNVFRKYYTMIMNLVYRLMNDCLLRKDYINAKNYFFCYYSCINSLRSLKLVPNENLMNTILKFDKIDLNDLLDKVSNSSINNELDIDKDKEIEIKMRKDNQTNTIYVIYNFMKNSFLKEKDIIQKINELKGSKNLKLNILNKEGKTEKIIQPKIKFNNGKFQYECYIYNQDKILEDLNKQYELYSANLNEFKLDNKILFESCLNIVLFTRNTNFFEDNDDLIDTFKVIFNVYFQKIIDMNKDTINTNESDNIKEESDNNKNKE